MKRLLFALLLIVSAVVNAQGKWVKLAPFPEPSEELLGVAAGGKMYVFCGLAPGWKPKALVYEYDPPLPKDQAPLQWTWWVKVKLVDGTIAWLKNPKNFRGMDRRGG